MEWYKNEVGISELDAVKIITEQSARPVCIFVIGADCDLKNKVVENFVWPIVGQRQFDHAWLLSQERTGGTTLRYSLNLNSVDIFCVTICEDSVANPEIRHELTNLVRRRLDVETTIGLLIDDFEQRGDCLKNRMAFAGDMSYASGQICERLHLNPPTMDEYNVLLKVTG